jgi:hypothetical protein
MDILYGQGHPDTVKRNFKATYIPPAAIGDSSAAAGTFTVAEANALAGAGVTNADLVKLRSITVPAATVNLLANTDRAVKVKVVALAAVDTAGGVFAWSPGAAAIIQRVFLDVTTKSTGACTVDVGVAANATTLSDILLDGVDVGTAAGLFDNITEKGTNGRSRQRCGATQYVTGSVASGASAGIVGNAYIEYILI